MPASDKKETTMAEIAFFGLGTMGVPMAINLLKAGHHLHVLPHNGHMDGPLAVRKYGASIHETLQETVGDAEFVISVVPDDAAVRDLYLNQAMLEAIRPGTIIIEMTSCSPGIVREVARFFAEKRVRLIDAPITGALPRAIDGTLTIMGAGDPAAFAAAEGVFSAISERVFQLGEIGNGKLIKAMTNLLGAINLAAVGEFYRFALSAGLDMETLQQVVAVSAGGSTQFERNFNKMVADDYRPTFALALLRKDMSIALASAQRQGLSLPLSEEAFRLFKRAAAFDKEDCSAIAKVPAGV